MASTLGMRGQLGFRNQVVRLFVAGNTVIINKNGFFIYNGTPAAGKLVVALAPVGGTDKYGNAYPANIAAIAAPVSGGRAYLASTGPNGSSDPALVLDTATIVRPGQLFMHQAAGSSRSFVELDGASLHSPGGETVLLQLYGESQDATVPAQAYLGPIGTVPVTTTFLEVDGNAAINGNMKTIVSGAVEAWHNLGAPIAGWAVGGGGRARYKLLSDSGLVLVEFANITLPAAPPADGTIIWTAANGLPAAYRPAIGGMRYRMYASSTIGTEIPAFQPGTDGSIQVFGVGGTTIARMDGEILLSTI